MWSLQVEAVQCLGQVWAPDLPGFGAEPPLGPERQTPGGYADWVADRLRREGRGPAHVVGYSMGGSIALLLALRHPDLVTTLTVCCSSPCWGRGGRKVLAQVFAGLGGRFSMEVFQKSILWACSRNSQNDENRAVVVDMVARAHRPTMLALYRAMARLDLVPTLGAIQVPALVVAGSRDWIAPPSHARGLAGHLAKSELHVVSGADHVLCLTHSAFLSAIITEFLNRYGVSKVQGARRPVPTPDNDAMGSACQT
jgi:pimeloyl-ACP methyl ester carboxylesterase